MEVILKIHLRDGFQFPKFANVKDCDYDCPMFLWDDEGHDFCAASQSRTDKSLVKCPFFDTREYVLEMED